MIRRFAHATAAVLATAWLASCATFSDNDTAARVGDIELSQDDIDDLLGLTADTTGDTGDTATASEALTTANGDEVRSLLGQWIRVALVESAIEGKPASEIESTANLTTRMNDALKALAQANPDAGRSTYDQGVPLSPSICLAAIPVDTVEEADQIVAEIEAGLPFADAASEYATDPGLADNGGVVLDSGGNECFLSSDLNPAILTALDGTVPGTPVTISLDTLVAVVQMRPYDELSDAAHAQLADYGVAADTLPDLVESTDVYVDSRYGYWDAETASVLPLGG